MKFNSLTPAPRLFVHGVEKGRERSGTQAILPALQLGSITCNRLSISETRHKCRRGCAQIVFLIPARLGLTQE
jgi:hypothetical protein